MVQHDPDVVARSRAVTGGLVAAMAFFLALPSGCSSPLPGDIVVISTGSLWTGPMDGATNLDVSALALFVDEPSPVFVDAAISNLVSHLVLKTWPEETIVPSTIEEDHDSFTDAKILRIVPNAPLDERWYLMEVTNLLDGKVTWTNIQGQETLRTRFRMGSSPRVRGIDFCEKSPSSMTVYVHVSEPVEAELPAEEIISIAQNGTKQDCELLEKSPQGSFDFLCPNLTSTSSVVTVSTGLKAPTGATVPPGTFTIDMNSLSPGDFGCPGFHPPI